MLAFSLNFNNPLEISPKFEQDKIFINLTKAVEVGYIQSWQGKGLRNEDFILIKSIRKQLEDNEFNKNQEKTNE